MVSEQWDLLHYGSPFLGWLFDEESLCQIIIEHKSDVQVNANASLASSLSKVLLILTKKSGLVTSAVAPGYRGSPLADHPAATSASRGASYAGRKFLRGGRQRRVGGRGRGQVKVDPKVPKNPSFKRGFQE